MNIKTEFPPNIVEIELALGIEPSKKPVYTYGNTIYNPFERQIEKDVEIHESVHMRQQGSNPELWWVHYLHDKEFRKEAEIEAYATQYAAVLPHLQGAKFKQWVLEMLAYSLSGSEYGNIMTIHQARTAIRKRASLLRKDNVV